MLSVQDLDLPKFDHIIASFRRVRDELGIAIPANGESIKFTGTQSKTNGALSRNPIKHLQ